MRKSWTDERLDGFRIDVGRRFDAVDQRFDAIDQRFKGIDRRIDELDHRVDKRFDEVDHELHRINDRLDGMSKAMIFAAVTMTGSILAGYAAFVALVVTQT
jgi:hypothetical protein